MFPDLVLGCVQLYRRLNFTSFAFVVALSERRKYKNSFSSYGRLKFLALLLWSFVTCGRVMVWITIPYSKLRSGIVVHSPIDKISINSKYGPHGAKRMQKLDLRLLLRLGQFVTHDNACVGKRRIYHRKFI